MFKEIEIGQIFVHNMYGIMRRTELKTIWDKQQKIFKLRFKTNAIALNDHIARFIEEDKEVSFPYNS